jgi:archaellum component FlaD/FlaE
VPAQETTDLGAVPDSDKGNLTNVSNTSKELHPAEEEKTEETAKSDLTTEKADDDVTSKADKASESSDQPTNALAKPADQVKSDSDKTDDDQETDPTELTAKEIDAEAEAQAKHDAAIQQLVDSKQYFLPINAVEKRRTKRVVVLGIVLSIILALAWVDVALDAGLIHIAGVKPVTHFFSS